MGSRGLLFLFKEGTMHVGIVMGSDSDLPVMKKAAEVLSGFGVTYDRRSHLPIVHLRSWKNLFWHRKKKGQPALLPARVWRQRFPA